MHTSVKFKGRAKKGRRCCSDIAARTPSYFIQSMTRLHLPHTTAVGLHAHDANIVFLTTEAAADPISF